ncbi:hypothetical protein U9M48_043625 [Paspalum notatum var. saurae]|uniref:IBB domain-containing protein n=1 Tax=Paspalum notatum var. saurae TaxID=547442 RepID=A0AAQ3XHB4_PASNO
MERIRQDESEAKRTRFLRKNRAPQQDASAFLNRKRAERESERNESAMGWDGNHGRGGGLCV